VRRAVAIGLALLVTAAVSGCAAGFPGAPTYVTDVSATINGLVASTEGGATSYWVEYGAATSYGQQSAVRSQTALAKTAFPVSIPIAGLSAGTAYHYRICAQDSQEGAAPGCSGDATFTTKPPGGRSGIAFFSIRGPGSMFTRNDVIVMASDGSGQTNITNSPTSSDAWPVWSPDARKIAYSYTRYDDELNLVGTEKIYVANPDGSNAVPLTDDSAFSYFQAWSPDGKQIAFTRNSGNEEEIYLMDADGTHLKNLTRHPGSDSQAAWSPDGTRIAFVSVPDANDPGEIYVMNADGSNRTRLTTNSVYDAKPAWSPDGTKIAFTRLTPGNLVYDIFTMDPDGSHQADLTNRPGNEVDVTWSPDGSKVAFGDLTEDIFSMSVQGGPVTNLTNNSAGDFSATWSPRP
jgi:Tol biopolymer transport system component